jgi:hypothetical protein
VSKTIWAIIGLLLGSWVVGVIFKIAEDVIHILLIPAAMLGVFNVWRGLQKPATE